MIYWSCLSCNLHFRKGRLRKCRCIRCGSTNIFEEDIPADELTIADEVVDEQIRRQYLGK